MNIQTVKQHSLFPLICVIHSTVLCLIEETTVAKQAGEHLCGKAELSNKEADLLVFVAGWYGNVYEMLEVTSVTLMELVYAAASGLEAIEDKIQGAVDQYRTDVYPEWLINRSKFWDALESVLPEKEVSSIEDKVSALLEQSPAYSAMVSAINGVLVEPEDTLLQAYLDDIANITTAEADNSVEH